MKKIYDALLQLWQWFTNPAFLLCLSVFIQDILQSCFFDNIETFDLLSAAWGMLACMWLVLLIYLIYKVSYLFVHSKSSAPADDDKKSP